MALSQKTDPYERRMLGEESPKPPLYWIPDSLRSPKTQDFRRNQKLQEAKKP
jgi:hypothetical protein